MNPRRGFTLIEILLSIVITGVVVLLVYGVADAAFTTRTRLDERRLALQTERAVRVILHEALRNAQPALRSGDQAFVLEDARDSRGRPADRLTFVATGGFPPLTDESRWVVRVEPTNDGVIVSARPLGVRGATARALGRVAGATGIDVRVREQGNPEWRREWSFLSIVPAAVEVTFSTDSAVVGVPVRVALPMGGIE